MTYNPISGAAVQYSKSNGQVASGYWLKFYIANTTTPLSMAIDSAGSSPLLKCKLNDKGYPITNENDNTTVFIPYVNQDYRFVLYKNEEDADADLTSSADVNIASVSSLAGAANSIFTVASVANLSGLTGVSGQQISVGGYQLGSTVGGGKFVWGSGRHNGVTHIDPNRPFPDFNVPAEVTAWYLDSGVDADCWVRIGSVITPLMAGARGDGVDDNAAMIALSSIADSPIIGRDGDTYAMQQPFVCGTFFNLNGSTLKFDVDGSVECVDMRNNSSLFNGAVVVNGTNPSGSGQFQTPVVVGKYGSGEGYSNVNLHDLEITTNRPNGNGIFITGDSHNITIERIKFPSSASLGRAILAHWGGADDPTSGTFHPHDILINNIQIGSMTDTSGDGSGVFVSAAYNVKVTNVTAESIAWGAGIVSTFAGDYGAKYAPAGEQDLMMNNVEFENCFVKSATDRLVKVDNKDFFGDQISYAGPILRNVRGKSLAGADVGFVVSNCVGGYADNCGADGFSNGFVYGADVRSFNVIGGDYKNSVEHNISVSNGTTPPVDCIVMRAKVDSASTGAGSHAGVFIGNSLRCKVLDCVSGGAGSDSTTVWGVRVDSAAVGSVVQRNNVESATAVAYSLGAGADLDILESFKDNTAASGVTYQSGAAFVPITKSGTGVLEYSEWIGAGTPEGTITADIGSICHRNGSANSLYVKQTGNGLNTGWVAK